jgi:hypothetical protein
VDVSPGRAATGETDGAAAAKEQPLAGWYYEVEGPQAKRIGRLDSTGNALATRLPRAAYKVSAWPDPPGREAETPPAPPLPTLEDAGVGQIVDRWRMPLEGPDGILARIRAEPEAAESPEPEAAESPEPEAAESPEPDPST